MASDRLDAMPNTPLHRATAVLLLPLALAACSSGAATNPQAGVPTQAAAASAAGAPSPSTQPITPVGQPVHVTDPSGAVYTVTVSNARTAAPPPDWSDKSVVMAQVDIDVTSGTLQIDPTQFTFATAAGERTHASTIISNVGLPSPALTSTSLTGPNKARGLIAFSTTAPLQGAKIELNGDAGPAATWTL